MKKIISAMLLFIVLITGQAWAEHTIQVHGSATIQAEPDIVTIHASDVVQAETIGEAQDKLGSDIQKVKEALMTIGIAETDIVTCDYNFYQVYDYNEDVPKPLGYQGRHGLQVTCRNRDILDDVIMLLTENGIKEIDNIAFDISTRHELYLKALELSASVAHEKAEVLAAATGEKLGSVIRIEESYSGDSVSYANTEEAMDDMGSMKRSLSQGTGIYGGDVSVNASIMVEYEVQ